MFYGDLFLHLDLSDIPEYPKTGRKGFSNHSMICAFVVMKCEGFSMITDLVDYLNNNLIIAYYCGFDINLPLPSYWSFDRFLRKFDNSFLQDVMQSQVRRLADAGIVDSSFIGLDSTPVMANTSQNNPKSFLHNKFHKSNHPKSDPECGLGVHSASNQTDEKKFQYYWGYKNHVLVDCITGLPICEMTTSADVPDSTVALDILKTTNSFLPIEECYLLADKGYDVKNIYNTVKDIYHGECFIPINKRNTKSTKLLPTGHPVCEAGLAMNKDGRCYDRSRVKQKFCCPHKRFGTCPINHPKFNNGKKHRGCTKWVTLPSDYRLQIDRNSSFFKKTYSLRTECERYNSRFKATGQERMWVRNRNSVTNLNTLAHITLLAVALAACITSKNNSYRCLKRAKRSA